MEGVGNSFCSAGQFASWRRCLCARMKEVEDGVGETKAFEAEQTPFFYSPEHDNYQQDPQLKYLQHTNVMEQAIQFWCTGLSFNSMLARL